MRPGGGILHRETKCESCKYLWKPCSIRLVFALAPSIDCAGHICEVITEYNVKSECWCAQDNLWCWLEQKCQGLGARNSPSRALIQHVSNWCHRRNRGLLEVGKEWVEPFLLWLQHGRITSSVTVKQNYFASVASSPLRWEWLQQHLYRLRVPSEVARISAQLAAPGILCHGDQHLNVGGGMRRILYRVLLAASSTAIFMPPHLAAVLWPKDSVLWQFLLHIGGLVLPLSWAGCFHWINPVPDPD